MNTARYIFSKIKRYWYIDVILSVEIAAFLIFGAMTYAMLGSQDEGNAPSPSDGAEYIVLDPETFAAAKEAGIGEDWSYTYPAVVFDGKGFSYSFTAVGADIAARVRPDMEEGEWYGGVETTAYAVVTDAYYADVNGIEAGDILELSYYDGEVVQKVEATVCGICATGRSFAVTTHGIEMTDAAPGAVYLFVGNGETRFYPARQTVSEEEFSAAVRFAAVADNVTEKDAAWLRLFGVPTSQSEVVDNGRDIIVALCIAFLLLAVSTVAVSSAVMHDMQIKENAIAYILGSDRLRTLVAEAARAALVFVLPAVAAAVVIAASLPFNALMTSDMNGYFAALGMIAAVYFAANAASFTAQAKAKPLDGLKEE